MAGKQRYSVAQVVEALRRARGMKGPAAQILGCHRETVENYSKRYPTVAAVIAEERENMTDVAELSLVRAIQKEQGWAVCFYLKTQGKNRGYVERSEVSGPDGGPIEHALSPATVALLDQAAAYKRDVLRNETPNDSSPGRAGANGKH